MQADAKQKQLIHIAKAQCGVPDDQYRAIIAGRTQGKKTSCKELTYDEADQVINYFVKNLGFKIKSSYIRTAGEYRRKRWAYANSRRSGNKPLPGNVVAFPSPMQLDMIATLSAQVAWKFADGYQRWLAKYLKISRITTSAQAQRCIEGLKGMIKNSKQ